MKINYVVIAIILMIASLVLGLYLGHRYYQNNPPATIETPIEIVEDSIERDSIKEINDSIELEIEHIDDEYNKEVSDIMSSTDSANLVFFTEYIKNYNNK